MIEFYDIPKLIEIVGEIRKSKEFSEFTSWVKNWSDKHPFHMDVGWPVGYEFKINIKEYFEEDLGVVIDYPDFLFGHCAIPHDDKRLYGNYYFLNVAMQSNHNFGYQISKKKNDEVLVVDNQIFLVDTHTPHWFIPSNWMSDIGGLDPFILINIPVPRRERNKLKPYLSMED